jgi:ABC-type uncharacterized transport system fused permease/ATPase subunit
VEQGILTERGWQEGYVVLKPSRWMSRFFFDALLPLNTALTRLETNAFSLLATSDAFQPHAREVYQQLADYRATAKRLARLAERLARGRPSGAKRTSPDETRPAVEAERTALQGPSLADERAQHAEEMS